MTSSQKFLGCLVLLAPLLIIINDAVVFAHPTLFFNRHAYAFADNNRIADYSFVICAVVGITGGFYLER